MKHIAVTIGLALLGSSFPGCSKRVGTDRPATSESELLGVRYPAGRWRLATFEGLDRATLWVGHIVIRHEHSQVELFRPPGWRPDPPNPTRSIAEALALAEKLRAQIAVDPSAFERLAREYSEDVVSKEEGGMLGGVRASQLAGSDFLDALAVLKPGDVSQPFQTPYGFHILKRYSPPIEERVAGERIVVGYQGVYGMVADNHRTRAQALELAREIADQARRDARSFRALVARYSENGDRVNNGEIGVYSTRDPAYMPVEVHRLAGIKVGEVTGPIDSRFGFEILTRVPASPRTEYAMTAIELRPDSNAGDPDGAMAKALNVTKGVLRELRAAPNRFRRFQQTFCCDRVQRWTGGRGDIDLTRALDRLSLGEIAHEPILHAGAYLVMKRLDPRTLPPEPSRLLEVPAPSDPDYEVIASNTDGAHLAAGARAFIGAVRASSAFPTGAMKTIADTLDHLADYLEQNEIDRVTARSTIHSTLASLENQLGTEQFGRLEAFGRRWVIRQIMPPGSVD
jgi:hypothetical protein